MSKIDGIRQGLLYGSTSAILWFHLRSNGLDVSIGDHEGAEYCSVWVYSPGGSLLLSEQEATEDSNGWYYLDDLNISTWELGRGYRARIEASDGTTVWKFPAEFFDVCMSPISEPLLSTSDIDNAHPQWQHEATAAISSSWVTSINAAHRELYHDLTQLRDSHGKLIYPHRLVDRSQLYSVAMIYTEHHIVENIIRATEDERKYYRERKASALGTLNSVFLDTDDDLTIDEEDDVQDLGGRFVR